MMGFSNLLLIRDNLINHGKDKNTPCAIVMKGSTSKQKTVVGTLDNIEKSKDSKYRISMYNSGWRSCKPKRRIALV